jgi:mannose-1-phosphate guanylyltransferase/mannose-6-phosphate isomerase
MEVDARSVVPVILSGGNGTRLWPMSRDTYPKQLLPLLDEVSLLQQTAWRVRGFGAPLLICREEQRFVVAEQLAALGVHPDDILLEPVARDTAPAVAAAAMTVLREHPGSLMLVCPAGHVIDDVGAFRSAVTAAAAVAAEGYLVSFGHPAADLEPGHSYLRAGARIGSHPDAATVAEFVERPDEVTARRLSREGWTCSSGMFLLPPALLLEELRRLPPALCRAVATALETAHRDLGFLRLEPAAFAASPALSVETAVMQQTERAAVVEAGFACEEVGSWSDLWRMADHDVDGNVLLGDVVSRGSNGCYLRADGVLVATVGLRDTVVVATKDAVLVADRSADHEVKELVETLRARSRPEASAHRVVYRPWGCYETVDAGPGYQVKHITVKPGRHLSLQKHAHRAEHWVVISGAAEVARGDDTTTLTARMSIDVPAGCVHRLGNPGPEILHLVEVRTGSYLGEDDIVRLDEGSDDSGQVVRQPTTTWPPFTATGYSGSGVGAGPLSTEPSLIE